MPTIFYLKCKKLSANGSIAEVGGVEAGTGLHKHFTEAEAISDIDKGRIKFRVRDAAGNEVEVRVCHHGSHRFLETHRDGVKTDNLERLPICQHSVITPPSHYRPSPVHRGHCVTSRNSR